MAQTDLSEEEARFYQYNQHNPSAEFIETADKWVYLDPKREKWVRPHKGYIRYLPNGVRQVNREALPPRFFIFCYRGWEDADEFYTAFIKSTKKNPAAHIHGICALSDTGSFYTGHVPYAEGEKKVRPLVREDGFKEWLYTLPEMLHTMLPPRQMGFDMVDLQRYRVLSEPPATEPNTRN
jgi:hypothetical protein